MDDPTEHWLPVPGYEGLYEVSDLGRVRSLPRRPGTPGNLILKPTVNNTGYHCVGPSLNGKQRVIHIHVLVLAAFEGPCPAGMEVLHGPGGRLDNRLVNLSYGTRSQNNGPDRVRDGTAIRGEQVKTRKLTDAIVAECRRRHAGGETRSALAREFGVSWITMNRAITGMYWAHVS